MPGKIEILIAEDHEVVRAGLKMLIGADPALRIVGEADDGAKAVQLACRLRPDVVLLDLAMPKTNGLQACREIRRLAPDTRVLVLSAYRDLETVQQLVDAGVAGYMTKHSAAEELLTAIHEVSQGRVYFSSSITAQLRARERNSFHAGRSGSGPVRLTPRESEVVRQIASGEPNKAIASSLGLSIKTIEKHRQAAMDKLRIHDTAGLTRYALEKGFVQPLAAPASAHDGSSAPLRLPAD